DPIERTLDLVESQKERTGQRWNTRHPKSSRSDFEGPLRHPMQPMGLLPSGHERIWGRFAEGSSTSEIRINRASAAFSPSFRGPRSANPESRATISGFRVHRYAMPRNDDGGTSVQASADPLPAIGGEQVQFVAGGDRPDPLAD